MNHPHHQYRHHTSHIRSHNRSRSPDSPSSLPNNVKRYRSRSPHGHFHNRPTRSNLTSDNLPFHARPLHKQQLETHRALFAEYLDVQKDLDIDRLNERELKGRWKSFLGKWNRGELAEGWYDPETKIRAERRYAGPGKQGTVLRDSPRKDAAAAEVRDEGVDRRGSGDGDEEAEGEDDDEDDIGPSPPPSSTNNSNSNAISGPAIASLQDLQNRHELHAEAQEQHLASLRQARKHDRKLQKERLEDLAPRAEPGTRERQLEKKREKAAANRSYRDAAKDGGGAEVEVGDGVLMGEDDDGGYQGKKKALERAKNEREIRKEEVLRARAAEREERMRGLRAKEERTLEMLRELARERFG